MSKHIRLGFGLRILLDRCGLVASGFVLFIWLYSHVILFYPILIPQYKDNNISFLTIAIYLFLSMNTIVAFFRAMLSDPGKVANAKKEEIDWRTWEKCVRCCIARPPRSHHCSRCGYCVLRMDHHCPWINNCVGGNNFWIFYMLLFYAYLFILTSIFLYHSHLRGWMGVCKSCDDLSWIDPVSTSVRQFSYALEVFSFMGLTLLLAATNLHTAFGVTSIEAMQNPREMMAMARERRRIFPRRDVLSKICGTNRMLLWFLPCRTYHRPTEEDPEPFTV